MPGRGLVILLQRRLPALHRAPSAILVTSVPDLLRPHKPSHDCGHVLIRPGRPVADTGSLYIYELNIRAILSGFDLAPVLSDFILRGERMEFVFSLIYFAGIVCRPDITHDGKVSNRPIY